MKYLQEAWRHRHNAGMSAWCVYLLRCSDGSFYTGITTDVHRRLRQHNGELVGGARYTRCRRPVQLVHVEAAANRSEAAAREYRLRRAPVRIKQALAQTDVAGGHR